MYKYIYIILATGLLFCSNLFAQCPLPNGINTDPLNPSNPDPSANPIGNPINTFQWFNTSSTPIVGGFQWSNPIYNTNINGINGTVPNPYNQVASPFTPFAKTNTNDGIDRSDYKPEDGWELIKSDLGFYADGSIHGNNNQLYYIILYNKHQGIMRFLGLWPDANDEVDYVELKMRVLRKKENTDFPSTDFVNKVPNLKPIREKYYYNDDLKVSNIFSVNKDEIRPLDQKIKEKDLEASIIVPIAGQRKSTFFWFDMQVAYDPCVCMGKSYFALSYKGIKKWSIILDTREQGKYTKDIYNKLFVKDPCENAPELIVGGIVAAAGVAATSGASAVSAVGPLGGFVKGVLCLVGADPSTIKKAELFAKFAEASADIYAIGSNWEKYNKIEGKDYYTLFSDTSLKVSKKAFAELITKSTKALSTGSSLINYLGNSKDKAKIVQPTVGTIPKSTLDTTYGIATDTAYADRDILLAIPGSKWDSPNYLLEFQSTNANDKTLPGYPLYNEALGTLAFIETPQVKLYSSSSIFATHLIKDLKYIFNPLNKFDMNKTATGMALEFVFKCHDGKTTKAIMSELVDKNEIREVVNIFQSFQNLDLECFATELVQVNLKVFIDYETLPYLTGSKTRRGMQVFTVPCNIVSRHELPFIHGALTNPNFLNIQLADLQSNLPPIFRAHSIFSIAQGNNVISSPLTFNQNHVIFSDDEIVINADLSTTNGAVLIVRSSKSITVSPGVTIGANVILEIGDNHYGGWFPQEPLPLEQISTFCNTKTLDGIVYNADQFEEARLSNLPTDINKESYPSITQITLYPNPATKLVNIAKPENNIISKSTVLDITGKQLFTLNGNINSLDVSNLMAGMYVIQMVLQDGTSVSNKLQIVR